MIRTCETTAVGLIDALYHERGFSDVCRREYLYHWRRFGRWAGTAAEELAPGRGHLLLGHERRTFEAAYWARDRVPPVELPEV